MKVSIFYIILLAASIQLLMARTGSGQGLENISVTIEMNSESLETLFQKIEKQTGLKFVYSVSLIRDHHNITLPPAQRSVKQTLDLAFAGTNLRYEAGNGNVLIYQGEELVDSEGARGGMADQVDVAVLTVTGTVTDNKGNSMPGVNIVIKGTATGTSTDATGRYSINTRDDDVLVFSFIGYKTVEVDVNSRSIIDAVLAEDVGTLEEVVVNGGYYKTTDKLKTGSIVKVTAKDIERQPVTSPLMALQGRVPGLEITPTSGAPGVAPKIRIRGINSLRQHKINATADLETDGNYPLYVIDGVPVSSTPLNSLGTSFTSGGYDPLSTINPANIESIEVLKDGDATAIYGSRGANGVILITTKRSSKSSDRTNVDASIYTGVGHVSKQMKVLNLEQYLSMRREALANSGITPQQAGAFDLYLWDTTRYTNWQKELLGGNAMITDIQAGISSGTKNTSIRFNGGYHKETLIFPGDFGYYKLSGQLSVNHKSANQKFNISISSTYGLDNSHFGGDLTSAAFTLPPNAPKLYNDDGSLNWEIHDLPGQTNVNTWINPLSYLKGTQDANSRNNISNMSISYELLPGLLLSANAGYSDASRRETRKIPRSSQSPSSPTINGFAYFSEIWRSSWIVEPKVSYTKQIENHNLNFIVGGTWQQNTSAWRITKGEAYAADALLGSLTGAGKVSITRDDFTEYRFNSVYARLGYNWREKYLLNLTGRRDGSSRFGTGNRFGNFGSVGAAWIFSSEKFVQQVIPFMNFGKFRASYGITGSDNIGDYNYYNLYSIADTKYGGLTGIVPFALYNPDYAWEGTKKLEAAVELSFAQSRIGLEISWYRNRSSNQLVSYPLSDVTGFQSVQTNFDATVQNSGWEAVLRGDLLNAHSWRWNMSINVSLPRNKLVKFDGIEDSPYATIYKVGEPLSVRWLYTWRGINKETGLHDFVDENGDGLFNALDRTIQNLAGTVYYGGINNTIQFKNFEISFLFQFSHRQSTRYLPGLPGTRRNQPVDVLDRWQNSSDETDVQKFSYNFQSSNGILTTSDAYTKYGLLLISNYNSADASFIRLKTLSIGYRLPNHWLGKAMVRESRLFIQGQNLWTLTKYEGLDPETGSGLPPLRMITIGMQLKF